MCNEFKDGFHFFDIYIYISIVVNLGLKVILFSFKNNSSLFLKN